MNPIILLAAALGGWADHAHTILPIVFLAGFTLLLALAAMSTSAVKVQGLTLHYDSTASGSPYTWVAVGEIKSINGVEITRALLEATHLGSTFDEIIDGGLTHLGPVTVVFQHVLADTGQAAILTNLKAGTKTSFKITYASTKTVIFDAFVEKHSLDFQPGQVVMCTVTLRPTDAAHVLA